MPYLQHSSRIKNWREYGLSSFPDEDASTWRQRIAAYRARHIPNPDHDPYGYVYVVGIGLEFCKIGSTSDPETRFKTVQYPQVIDARKRLAHVSPIRVMWVFDRWLFENWLRVQFAEKRVADTRDWFRLTLDDLDDIRKLPESIGRQAQGVIMAGDLLDTLVRDSRYARTLANSFMRQQR